jgi:hypothetical protein
MGHGVDDEIHPHASGARWVFLRSVEERGEKEAALQAAGPAENESAGKI